jgi:hypothetical protein
MQRRKRSVLSLGDAGAPHTAKCGQKGLKESYDHVKLARERFAAHRHTLLGTLLNRLTKDTHGLYSDVNRALCGRLCLFKESRAFWGKHQFADCYQNGTLERPHDELYWPSVPVPSVHPGEDNGRRIVLVQYGKVLRERVRHFQGACDSTAVATDIDRMARGHPVTVQFGFSELLQAYKYSRKFRVSVRNTMNNGHISFDGVDRSMTSLLKLARRINDGNIVYWLNRVRLGFAIDGEVDMDAFWKRSQKILRELLGLDVDEDEHPRHQGHMDELAVWSLKAYLFRLFRSTWTGWKKYAQYRHRKKAAQARFIRGLKRSCFGTLLRHCLFQKSAVRRSCRMGPAVFKRRTLLKWWQKTCDMWRTLEAMADTHSSRVLLKTSFRCWTQWFMKRITKQYNSLQFLKHVSNAWLHRSFATWREFVVVHSKYTRIIHFVQQRQARRILTCSVKTWVAEVQRRRSLRNCLEIAELCAEAQAQPVFVLQFELIERLFGRWTTWVDRAKTERKERQKMFTADAYSHARVVTSHFCHWRWAVCREQAVRRFQAQQQTRCVRYVSSIVITSSMIHDRHFCVPWHAIVP